MGIQILNIFATSESDHLQISLMVDIFQVPGSAQLLARDLQNIVDALKGSNSMEEFLKFEGIVENENKENPWSVIDSNGGDN